MGEREGEREREVYPVTVVWSRENRDKLAMVHNLKSIILDLMRWYDQL